MTSGFPRVNCAAAGCHRGTTTIEPLTDGRCWLNTGTPRCEWLCGTHWSRVPRAWKRRRTKLLRRFRKVWPDDAGWSDLAPEAQRDAERLLTLFRKMWRRMVGHVSGAGGIDEELRRLGL